jgi:molecular chaperone GrpE (heat shock protein)
VSFMSTLSHQETQALQEVIAENAKLARQLEELDKGYKEVKAKVEQTRAQIQNEKQKGGQMRGQVEDKRELVSGVRQSYEGALVERVA